MTQQQFDFQLPKRRINVPQTSREAYDSIKEDKKRMQELIQRALEEMKVGGTSEEIADHLGLKHDQVWKRLSEMDNVFNTGIKRKQSSGRKAMVRQLKVFRIQKIV